MSTVTRKRIAWLTVIRRFPAGMVFAHEEGYYGVGVEETMNVSIKKKYKRLTIMRWVARIASLLSILVLLMFLVGEGFDTSKITATQWVGFVFFPLGLVAGFVIGWKNELLGGAVSIISLFAFYVIYGLLLSNKFPRGFAFLVFSIPAFLFLATSIYAESAIGSQKREEETAGISKLSRE